MRKYLKGKTVLCLGDSVTAGALASSAKKNFVSVLARLSGAKVVNYGAGGSRIARQRKPSENPRLDRDFLLRADEMQSNADYVVVFGGTNDFGHGDAPLGCITDTDTASFYGCVYCLFEKLYSKYPNAKIVAITPMHRVSEYIRCEKGDVEIPLSDYVRAIKEVSAKLSVPVLDLYSSGNLIPDIPANKQLFFAEDGLHPNDEGHKRIAERLYKFILSL